MCVGVCLCVLVCVKYVCLCVGVSVNTSLLIYRGPSLCTVSVCEVVECV